MIIGFDAKRANSNFTGLGNYSRFVINGLASFHGEHAYRMYIPRRRVNAAYDVLLRYSQVTSVLPCNSWGKRLGAWWRSFSIKDDLARDKVELYHGLSNELPFGIARTGMRSVVTIHDLIFLHYPKYYPLIDRLIYNYKSRSACRAADCIVAVSECTKRDIVKFYGIDPAKIEVVYQGCDSVFAQEVSPEEKARVRKAYGLPEQFVFNVGTIEERKNLLLAVQAIEQLEGVHLVAVGKHTTYTNKVKTYIEEHQLGERVHLLTNVKSNDLPVLYHMASLFAYPSRFEGFGIPVIEALSAGIPVIAATGSCLEEAGGPHTIYVSPDDATALAKEIDRVLTDRELAQTMVERGREYVQRFEPSRLADAMNDLYERVMSRE